jgi:hypothetical protein
VSEPSDEIMDGARKVHDILAAQHKADGEAFELLVLLELMGSDKRATATRPTEAKDD